MTATDIIKQVQEDALEWLEMSDNPAELLAGILANKIVSLKNHIEYLEKRLDQNAINRNFGRHRTR